MSSYRHPSERIAIDYLKTKGHVILENNKILFINKSKIEIDIITFHPESKKLHFIEVKAWKSFYLHPVQKEKIKRKEKLYIFSKKYIQEILENKEKYKPKSNYKDFLNLLSQQSAWEIEFSFDLIWIKGKEIIFFPQIFFLD